MDVICFCIIFKGYVKGNGHIAAGGVLSGPQGPGQLPASVHVGTTVIGSRQTVDGLTVIGGLDLKGPFGCILTDDRGHYHIFDTGTSHIDYRKHHVYLLACIGHRSHPVATYHDIVVGCGGGGVGGVVTCITARILRGHKGVKLCSRLGQICRHLFTGTHILDDCPSVIFCFFEITLFIIRNRCFQGVIIVFQLIQGIFLGICQIFRGCFSIS